MDGKHLPALGKQSGETFLGKYFFLLENGRPAPV